MNRSSPRRTGFRHRLGQLGIAACLLGLGGLALAGPHGLLEWSRQRALLDSRETHIAGLEAERAELANKVDLLDPNSADPDLVSELVRRDLNVVHPDEYVIELEPQGQAQD